MNSTTRMLFAFSALITPLTAFATPTANKIELWCSRGAYDFSIHVRNSQAQGGIEDNSLFIFLNGGYAGVDEVSKVSTAFGKGDVTYLMLDEKAWNECQATASADKVYCELRPDEHPIKIWGRRDFQGAAQPILEVSRFIMSFKRDASTGIGHFDFDFTEAPTKITHRLSYDLPCR